MRDHGCQLFDVFSGEAMVKTLQEGFCFDADIYEDQQDPNLRQLVIETVRVRKEFVDAEKALTNKKARQFARKMSALGQSTIVREFCENIPEDPDRNEVEKSPFRAPKESVSSTARSNILTRKVRRTLTDILDDNQNVLSVPSSVIT